MNGKKKKISMVHIMRRVVQTLAFVIMPGLFVSAFYAIKDIFMAVKEGTFAMSTQAGSILLLMGVLMVTVFMGRFFCGFICSFGAMGDLLWFISKKTLKLKFKPGEKLDKVLKAFKYILLVFIVVFIWGFELVSFGSLTSPWTIFGMYATFGNWPSASYLFSIGGLLLLLIMIGSFFIERFFCRYICPLGAVFAVSSKLRFFHIRKNREKCGACRICTKNCSMGIPLYKVDKVTSGECINCFECVDVCPRENVKANPVPAVASAASVIAVAGLVYVGNIASSSMESASASTTVSSSISEVLTEIAANEDAAGVTDAAETTGNYADGTYTGSARGFKGTTSVSVTVENGYITDITIVSYNDDREYFVRAQASVIPDIIAAQSTDVDTVSGATFSSNGIIDAVADALSGAQLSVTDTASTSAITPTAEATAAASSDVTDTASVTDAASVTQTEETTSPTDSAASATAALSPAATSTTAPATTSTTAPAATSTTAPAATSTTAPAATSTTAPTATPTPAPTTASSLYEDGTYTGSGTGFRGTTNVSVTVEGGYITDITIVSYQDDTPYFNRAQSSVLPDIIDTQGIDVDTVSGATFSSNGIIEAVADALGLSFTNPNSSLGGHGRR